MTRILKENTDTKGHYVWYSLAAVAGANTGLMLGMLGTLNWQECLILMCALGALAGGLVFTFFEMRALKP
ncbi:MAG TPA: hypothetical protein VGP62_09460 [Bryobacteraceae bacterium]|jgi:hypothetical protein|nr:hypothetical protein [Bryobacteraceae bacterium]